MRPPTTTIPSDRRQQVSDAPRGCKTPTDNAPNAKQAYARRESAVPETWTAYLDCTGLLATIKKKPTVGFYPSCGRIIHNNF